MTDNDTNGRVATEVVLKLFDTLRESSKDVRVSVEKQTDAIVHLSSLLKEGVTLDELKKIIDTHSEHSGKHLEDLDTCTESIQDNSGKILSLLKGMNKRVNIMIMIVAITFSLMTISYLYVSNSVEHMIKAQIEKSINEEEPIIYDDHDDLKQQIEDLREEIRGFENYESN